MPFGEVFAIGGAEAKLRRRTVLRAFVESAGGRDARIAVIPTASSLGHEIWDIYHSTFTDLGAADVFEIRPQTRAESANADLAEAVVGATGVFMTGGNQLKLTAAITGTPLGAAIHEAHRRGATVGGTSAGCSILSTHMMAFGASGHIPRLQMAHMAAGLGLVNGMVLDQHFQQRNRFGRLLAMVAQSPSLLGVGVDEDTAAVITGTRMRVIGRGAVTILDTSHVITDAPTLEQTTPMLVSGAVVHVLPEGSEFDLATRTYVVPTADLIEDDDDDEFDGIDESDDLLQTAMDVAAEGANPTSFARVERRRRIHPFKETR